MVREWIVLILVTAGVGFLAMASGRGGKLNLALFGATLLAAGVFLVPAIDALTT